MNNKATNEIKITIDKKEITLNIPKKCPHCEIHIFPAVATYTDFGTFEDTIESLLHYFSVVFKCPNCKEFFLIQYQLVQLETDRFRGIIRILREPPVVKFPLPDEVDKITPKFRKIYTQAQLSEYYKLDELTGMGYRKALEHLLRAYYGDYKSRLGGLIDKIDNPKIQPTALIAAWIGNDHTHPEVKHPSLTINDMKSYIESVVYHILIEYKVKSASNYIKNK